MLPGQRAGLRDGLLPSPRSWLSGVELCIDDIAEQVLSAGLLHVDDTLASGSRGRLECVLDVIKSKYRVSAEMMIQEGDEISCLKRKHGKARAVGRWCVDHPPLN